MGVIHRIAILTASVSLLLAGIAAADSFQAMAVQKAHLYGETLEAPEAVKEHYLSQGQEYARNYLREKMLELMAVEWLALDLETMQAGVAVQLNDWYDLSDLPLETQVRLLANENLNEYLDCGRFLPIEIQMDSTFTVNPHLTLIAKMKAPFDDVLRVQFGPRFDWTHNISSSLEYHVCNNSQGYDGLTMGLGFKARDWRLKLSYEVTADFVQMQHVGLARNF